MRLLLWTAVCLLAQRVCSADAVETYYCHWRHMDVLSVQRGKVTTKSDPAVSAWFVINVQGNIAFQGNAGDTGRVVRGRGFITIETAIKLNSDDLQNGVDLTTIFLDAAIEGEYFAVETRHSVVNGESVASTLSGKCLPVD